MKSLLTKSETQKTSAGTMKLFKLYRKYLALMGVEPLQPYQKDQAKKVFLRRFLVYTLCVLWLTCASIFIGFEAKTIHQYADAFYMSSCLTTILVVFSMFLWKLDIFFGFIEEFENLIEQRKISSRQFTL